MRVGNNGIRALVFLAAASSLLPTAAGFGAGSAPLKTWKLEATVTETVTSRGGLPAAAPGEKPAPDRKERRRQAARSAEAKVTAVLANEGSDASFLFSGTKAPPLSLAVEGTVTEDVTVKLIDYQGDRELQGSVTREESYKGSYTGAELVLAIGYGENGFSLTLSGSGRSRTKVWNLGPAGWRVMMASGEKPDHLTLACSGSEERATFEQSEGVYRIRCQKTDTAVTQDPEFGEVTTTTGRTVEATLSPSTASGEVPDDGKGRKRFSPGCKCHGPR